MKSLQKKPRSYSPKMNGFDDKNDDLFVETTEDLLFLKEVEKDREQILDLSGKKSYKNPENE